MQPLNCPTQANTGLEWGTGLASTIGHDAYHVTQFQQGEIYNKQTAPRLEREANQFQIRVGAKFGLTQSQIDYIRNDTHTLYNTPPY